MSLSTLNASLTSLRDRLQYTLTSRSARPNKMFTLVRTLLSRLLTWRTLFFLLVMFNLKSIPLSWHFRLFFNMGRRGSTRASIRKILEVAAAALPPPTDIITTKPVHPLFRPSTVRTHAPLGECDYNGHKSNSTYFSDLDVSRGTLVAHIMNPVLRLNALVPHGIRPGLCYPILGSVHTSFLREIKPYEGYNVRSRVLGWDRKWLVILSVFARKATPAEAKKDREGGKNFLKFFGEVGDQEVVFAIVLNKYVIKAGRMTVPPELCFAGSGWFPVRPEATETIRRYNAAGAAKTSAGAGHKGVSTVSESAVETGNVTPDVGPEKSIEDAANKVQNVALEAGRRLSMSAERKIQDEEEKNNEDDSVMLGWTWDEIEAERLRGLKIAEEWLGLDGMLRKVYEEDVEKEIW